MYYNTSEIDSAKKRKNEARLQSCFSPDGRHRPTAIKYLRIKRIKNRFVGTRVRRVTQFQCVDDTLIPTKRRSFEKGKQDVKTKITCLP